MKVIKTQNPDDWSLNIECKQCDSELEACAKDVMHEYYNGDMREPGYDAYAVSCPVCENVINILTDKIPKTVQLIAKGTSSKKFPYL